MAQLLWQSEFSHGTPFYRECWQEIGLLSTRRGGSNRGSFFFRLLETHVR